MLGEIGVIVRVDVALKVAHAHIPQPHNEIGGGHHVGIEHRIEGIVVHHGTHVEAKRRCQRPQRSASRRVLGLGRQHDTGLVGPRHRKNEGTRQDKGYSPHLVEGAFVLPHTAPDIAQVYVLSCSLFVHVHFRLLMSEIIIDEMLIRLVPRIMISAVERPSRRGFVGTTISQPGSMCLPLSRRPSCSTEPFMYMA